MKNIEEIIKETSENCEILPEEIPNLDLYMDQILTFFSERLVGNGYEEEELLTKSMINNYTKEKILSPVKGKKYTKEQIVQLLCILKLKQNLSLGKIKELFGHANNQEKIDISKAYENSLGMKNVLCSVVTNALVETIGTNTNPGNREEVLEVVLALSSLATFLNRISVSMIQELEEIESESR